MQQKKQLFSPIKQNILHFIDTLNISKRDFYLKTGISRGTLESNTGITEDTLAKLIAAYPNINIEWLFFKKGKMTSEYNTEVNNNLEEHIPDNNIKCISCYEKDKIIEILRDHLKTKDKLIIALEDRIESFKKLCDYPEDCAKKDSKAG